jgi:TetR/AcrR family transcriptional regulator, cholesterol catabolism regulator
MASSPATRIVRQRGRRSFVRDQSATRFDRRLDQIVAHATAVFCEKGYEGASMRDLSRATGMSLAGLYHYFESKERLLFLIQKHTFSTILGNLKEKLAHVENPEDKLRIFVRNHLEYFVSNQQGLKVLSHEDESLKNGFSGEIRAIKREYYKICLGLMEELRRERGLAFNPRTAVMSLFGMINWIYTWYNPRVDGDAATLAQQMADIVLNGIAQPGSMRKRKAE